MSKNPFGALRLIHDFPYEAQAAIEEKKRVAAETLKMIQGLGYAGIVTNVSAKNNYLQDEEEWEVLRFVLEQCGRMDLRVWLYDEKGYPSGGAGGQTVAEDRSYEARALVLLHRLVQPGETAELAFPHGHTRGIAAYAYPVPDEGIQAIHVESPYRTYAVRDTQEKITVVNESGRELLLVYFIEKPFYEGAHAQHNVCESRRYIDVSNKKAVAAFLRNTYQKYTDHVGDQFTGNGGGIEAIFTDEPSYMGKYINAGLYPDDVYDPFDDTIALYPPVNWGPDVERAFEEKRGYALAPVLLYLFLGKSERAKQVRRDFYQTLTDLYEASFFMQIAEYCKEHGLPFSGHILLEDDIRLHPVFEGNFFSLLRHMTYPGIDMLSSVPEKNWADAFTPKLVSSVAAAYGRKHVMSESSAHVEGGKVSKEQMLAAPLLQLALGVDIFTSYYLDTAQPQPDFQVWNRAISGTAERMAAGRLRTPYALYYPIETMNAYYVPENGLGDLALQKMMDASADSMSEAMYTILGHQSDFRFVDLEILQKGTCEQGSFRFGDIAVQALVLPACETGEALLKAVERLVKEGLPVYAQDCEAFHAHCTALCGAGAKAFRTQRELVGLLEIPSRAPIVLAEPQPMLMAMCKEGEEGARVLLVNSKDSAVRQEITLHFAGQAEVYSPRMDAVIGTLRSGDILQLQPYEAVILLGPGCKA